MNADFQTSTLRKLAQHNLPIIIGHVFVCVTHALNSISSVQNRFYYPNWALTKILLFLFFIEEKVIYRRKVRNIFKKEKFKKKYLSIKTFLCIKKKKKEHFTNFIYKVT